MINKIYIETESRNVYPERDMLGISGENKFETLQFNLDKFIDGQALIRVERKETSGTAKYEIAVEKGDNCYTLEVLSSLLAYKGTIKLQLVIMQENLEVFKSKYFNMKVLEAIEAGEEIPEQYPTWQQLASQKIIEIDSKLEEVTALEEDLEDKVQSGYFKGDKGDTGDPGKSAYEVWLDEGNVGTEEDFLESLKGENGTDGRDAVDGQDGHTPVKGTDYWTTQDKQEIVTDVETDLQPTITAIQNTANTAVSLAKLANQAKSYPTYQAFINYLNTAEKTEFIPGQSFMIQTKLIPDLWVYSVENTSVQYTYTTDEDFITYTNQATGGQVGYYKLAQLETQKVDLANYYTNTQTDTLLNAKVDKSSFAYDSNTETLSITIS